MTRALYLVARNAKGFGAGSPLLLANKYGIVTDEYLAGMHPLERLLTDHHLLNRVIEAENEGQKKAMKESEYSKKGVKRMVSAAERSEQLKEMRAQK